MAPNRSRRLVPRRRRTDEDEEEGSLVGDIDDESLSEGSAISGAEEEVDGEVSDVSGEEERSLAAKRAAASPPSQNAAQPLSTSTASGAPPQGDAFVPTAGTDAMLNGLKKPDEGVLEELHFDDAVAQQPGDPPNAPKAPRDETPAQRSKREHQEYLKQRDANPAFVPNRGGFFLHDDRNTTAPVFANRPAGRGRGRGRGFNAPFQAGRGVPIPVPSEKLWAHDLHERHENEPGVPGTQNAMVAAPAVNPPPRSLATVPPNRLFSFSTVLGNVPINVSMPGMVEKRTLPMVKKHHTLLPTHRPPLRRDKPVRISVPDAQPRYIFPSTDRSFIFIPRALRPNQQSYGRGRGRGSFHGSRRTSIYGGSTYTPSVAMSRKSSIGGPARDLRSPAAVLGPRPVLIGNEGVRPIVRMPVANMMPVPLVPTRNSSGGSQYTNSMNGSMSYGLHSTAIPMYQPRPQKTLSVADIESPASLSVKGPQQQHGQPFHQQMPGYGPGGTDGPGGQNQFAGQGSNLTSLSHIPEGAVYANPFQPFPMMQAPLMYGNPYYPVMVDGMQYGAPMPMPMPAMQMQQPFVPAPQPQQGSQQMGNIQQANAMAHESNGMVYYYGAPAGQAPEQQFVVPAPGVMGVSAMMNPQASYYYPNGNGVYYPSQSA